MATTAHVLFATNRQRIADAHGHADFGDVGVADGQPIACGTAEVSGIDIVSPSHGRIARMGNLTQGTFAQSDIDAIAGSGHDVLVFVHGAANSFEDAITRGAYNKTWLAAAPAHPTYDLIAFTWPGQSYQYWNIFGDFTGYRHDQAQAMGSAAHFGQFIDQVQRVRKAIGNRKLNLLCHSMGNYMLGAAVQLWYSKNPNASAPLFDTAILAAADEYATTFTAPNNGRLCMLKKLAREITVYFNYDDVLMHLSHIANCDYRLGYDGPPNKADLNVFDRVTYSMVDCTGVDDYISSVFAQPDRSHQYYRQSPTVRLDIAMTLSGQTPRRPRYDQKANVFSLFAQPLSV